MDNLRCVVERITFTNPENGFSVIKCRAKGYKDLVSVVGALPDVHVGSVLFLTGKWRIDPKYGLQFNMETFRETLPATVYGIEKYLGSGLIKGIGPKYAKEIVRRFKEKTLEVIDQSPDLLLEIKGIGKTRVDRIKKSWEEQSEIRNIMLFLQDHHVSTAHATKIYKAYGKDSINVVKSNPYTLADDIRGIGFKTADAIASNMGFGHEKFERLRSGLIYTLNKLADEGHVFGSRQALLEKGAELLEVEEEFLTFTLDEMVSQKDVVKDDEAVYLPPFYFSEVGIVRRMRAIFKTPGTLLIRAEGLLERVFQKTRMHYDDIQKEAIVEASRSKVLFLTGGPGTGKTTTTLGIITVFREAGARILLAAPTGRAAKRLSETVGMEARTIHRLLEAKPPEGYQRNEKRRLEGDVLVLDECSMIDVILMYNLLKAVPDTMTVIMVGDVDQLPSVGAGNVLRDMIDSGCFPVIRLKRIFRQARKSRIIMNAHRINNGKMPDISNGKESDFFFIEEEDPEKAVKTVVELVKYKLPRYYRVSSLDVQVLSPMQRGVAGTANLNQVLQNSINPSDGSNAGLRMGGYQFRTHDKVMQIRNNYTKEVFNGDIGIVERADTENRCLTVVFDGREVEYDVSELDELVLAYAATIHKSQGSEYPVVVMPVLMSHYVMLQRNLIYTGVTRARKALVIVGTKKALALSVHNASAMERNSRLGERLREAFGIGTETTAETE